MLKHLCFLTLTSFVLQITLSAQINTSPAHELKMQLLKSSSTEGINSNDQNSSPENDRLPSPIIINPTQSQKKEVTLSILKPDAVKNRHIGDIIARFEDHGLRIVAIKMVKLNKEEASQFYHMHRDRPFFRDLVTFMSSGPVVVLALEGDQAVSKNRQLMGATDPAKAEKGTIRADYADSVSQNAVHGSDSLESAREEIPFFFKPHEIYSSYSRLNLK